jgi:hypothetical protein
VKSAQTALLSEGSIGLVRSADNALSVSWSSDEASGVAGDKVQQPLGSSGARLVSLERVEAAMVVS